MPQKIYPINFPAGIQRDGTSFDSNIWTDGQWVRFQRGRAKKIRGYKMIAGSTTGIPRGAFVYPVTPNFNFYFGTSSNVQYITMDSNGVLINPVTDRTPAPFIASPNNIWQFDSMFSSVSNENIIIAYAGQNLAQIDNTVETPIYYGLANTNTPFQPTGISVSGGMVSLHPFLFFFGNDGEVGYTAANNPTIIENVARVTGSKIILGLPTRGGNSSPAGLLWSLDSVIRITNVGTTDVQFNFDTISAESSILSNQCVIEYDSLYYWCGVDRFLAYNGTVIEVPNNQSINFFFENLNYSQRQKVWATKITEFGEIWWHFPSGNSTECNHAIIFNVRENSWYDTAINRSDGYFDQTFTFPIWTDNQFNGTFNNYPIWIHEMGLDQVDIAQNSTAINSSITSPYLAWCGYGPDGQRNAVDVTVDLERFEPDMLQQGNMTLTVSGKQYARSQLITENTPYVFTPQTEKVDLRENYREMLLTFTSNTLGGYYEMGQSLIVAQLGDERA